MGIGLFLVSQIWIPVSYYLSDEPTSERFSWRMFSSVDLATWETELTILVQQNGQLIRRPAPLESTVQETYVSGIQKAHLDIVEKYMRQLITSPDVQEVRYVARGRYPSGKELEPIQLVLRKDGELEKI